MAMAIWGVDRVCLAVLYAKPPSDEEWAAWLALLRTRAGQDARILVETHSGPNAAQRSALVEATRDLDVRFAILTDSIIVRGIVTALAWLGVPHRAFGTDQHLPAAKYLELTGEELERVHSELPRLRHACRVKLGRVASTPPAP
jgi:hypothetical protein